MFHPNAPAKEQHSYFSALARVAEKASFGLKDARLTLDESQARAVQQALKNRVALIQGPPGTGKSFCGALLGRIIHDQTNEVILTVCYTNHALDQFLEDLIQIGVNRDSICRLGGSKKISDAIKPLTLQNLAQKRAFTKAENRLFFESKTRAEEAIQNMQPLLEELERLNAKSPSWNTIKEVLDALVPTAITSFNINEVLEPGQKRVGKNGKAIKADFLWKQWISGKPLPKDFRNVADSLKLWDQKAQDRLKTMRSWVEEHKESILKEYLALQQTYDEAILSLNKLKREANMSVLHSRRIIGCTTTGAAKYQTELESLDVGVLLVEEAGEILESHVLASLRENMKHLIMIGDHFQLRPKINMYELSVESRKGHDLNRSLFEKLIVAGFPHVTLELQHRMRPEISTFARELLYPRLRDSEKVNAYPALRGTVSNVVFVNHRNKEDDHGSIKRVSEDGLSKVNSFEADFAVAIVRYLLQQGYTAKQIVILTPYLGQLTLIRNKLPQSRIGKLDRNELLAAGEAVGKQDGDENNDVRVATVDNYQGEEADVIVCSLVRSNSNGSIGFLSERERVNVLLTRARHGMILIGDMSTLTGASVGSGRDIWTKISDMLQRGRHLYQGFPSICSRHPLQERIFHNASDFVAHSPDGGCARDCTEKLACGHGCSRKCHPVGMDGHKSVPCGVVISSTCPKGHRLDAKCGKLPDPCSYPIPARCNAGHAVSAKCSASQKDIKCETCKKLAIIESNRAKEEEAALKKKEKIDQDYFVSLASRKAELEKEKALLQQITLQQERALKEEQLKIDADLLRDEKKLRQECAPADFEKKVNALRAQAERLKLQKRDSAQGKVQSQPKASADVGVVSSEACDKIFAELCQESIEKLLQRFPAVSPLMKQVSEISPKKTPQVSSAIMARAQKLLIEGKWLEAKKAVSKAKGADAKAFSSLCHAKLQDASLLDNINNLESLVEAHVPETLIGCFSWTIVLDWALSSCSSVPLAHLGLLFGIVCLKAGLKNVQESFGDQVEMACKRFIKVSFPAQVVAVKVAENNAASRWDYEQNVNGAASEAMTKLLDMSGLEDVKVQFLNIYASCEVERSRLPVGSVLQKRFHATFRGNPGVGKTTVARLYGKFLAELKVLSGSGFRETSGAKLVEGGLDDLKKLVADLEAEKGGVLFIDEAYQLNPKTEMFGRRVLDYLVGEMENWIGKIVVVLAGYKKKMEELFEHNEGLPSRFPYMFDFQDYSDADLLGMFQKKLLTHYPGKPLEVEDGLNGKNLRILIKRLGLGRGKEGFGNARAVNVLFDRVLERQGSRLVTERAQGKASDILFFCREDLLGPDIEKGLDQSAAWKELKGMIGLSSVKQALLSLVEVIKTNCEREKLEKPLQYVTLNKCFLGNPGTGKTTVAKLYGEVLRDLGLLSKGELIVKKPSDFIGGALGQSEEKTLAILRASVGNVLLIDEAYGLHTKSGVVDPYKTAVIDAIVGEIQNVPGDDRCVLLCGYREEMEDMMNNSNPGLARRFAIDDAFVFDDYNDDELTMILNSKLRKRGLAATSAAQDAAVDVLSKQRRRRNFGNGGAVETLIGNAIQRMEGRLKGLPAVERAKKAVLVPEDFDPDLKQERLAQVKESGVAGIFSGLVGCRNIIEKMQEISDAIVVADRMGRDKFSTVQMNFRFVGSPGTGKTTVARRMGRMFHSFGLLASDDVLEVSASDLIASYVGQTGAKTRKVLEDGLGRVVFIDEAYRLKGKEGSFAHEAVDELVDLLTKPQFHRKLVVILAGYAKDIDELMQCNPGLESRFSECIMFENFSEEQCEALLKQKLQQNGYVIPQFLSGQVYALFKDLVKTENWGNGRDVDTLCKTIIQRAARRLAKDPLSIDADKDVVLVESEVAEPMSDMLKRRASVSPSVSNVENVNDHGMFQFGEAPSVPSLRTESRIEVLEDESPSAPPPKQESVTTWNGMDIERELLPLNEVLERLGWTAKEKIDELLKGDPDSDDEQKIVKELIKKGMDPSVAKQIVRKWVEASEVQRKKQYDAEVEALLKGRKPIVQCQVCKRTANYWAPCYVAPTQIGWEEVQIPTFKGRK